MKFQVLAENPVPKADLKIQGKSVREIKRDFSIVNQKFTFY